jgi:hypothetical protein
LLLFAMLLKGHTRSAAAHSMILDPTVVVCNGAPPPDRGRHALCLIEQMMSYKCMSTKQA